MVQHSSHSQGARVPTQEGDGPPAQTVEAVLYIAVRHLQIGRVPKHIVEMKVKHGDAWNASRKDTEMGACHSGACSSGLRFMSWVTSFVSTGDFPSSLSSKNEAERILLFLVLLLTVQILLSSKDF